MRALLTPFLLVLTLGSAGVVHAQNSEALAAVADSESRERAALYRITEGSLAGDIDAIELRRLTRLVERLRAYQLEVYADDVVSPRERVRLDRLHARVDRAITRAMEH